MARYLEWNYDNGIVTEYQRAGKCNQCGKCCKALITFQVIKPRRGIGRKGGVTTDETGIWSEIDNGRWRYFFKITEIDFDYAGCECLNSNQLCDYHNEKENICAWWPLSPTCIEPFPDCGYSFEQINEWKMSDL